MTFRILGDPNSTVVMSCCGMKFLYSELKKVGPWLMCPLCDKEQYNNDEASQR